MTVPVFGQVVHARAMRARGYWWDPTFDKHEVIAVLPRAPAGQVHKFKLRQMTAAGALRT